MRHKTTTSAAKSAAPEVSQPDKGKVTRDQLSTQLARASKKINLHICWKLLH